MSRIAASYLFSLRLLTVKYRGDKPRGFTVLTARPKPGRAVPSQANLIPLDLPEMGRLEFTPERPVRP
jgi:hypothetical protein